MRNRFLDLALVAASRFAGRRTRMVSLVGRLLMRLDRTSFPKLSLSPTHEKLKQLGRLLVAYARGRYRRIPLKAVITVVAAVLYFLNPFDLLPDAIPGLGLTDDLAVLSWVYQSLSHELATFREWERVKVPT